MDRVEIFAPGANGEDKFLEMSSNSQMEKKCLNFRGSVQWPYLSEETIKVFPFFIFIFLKLASINIEMISLSSGIKSSFRHKHSIQGNWGSDIWKRRQGEPAIKSTPEESRKLISLILERRGLPPLKVLRKLLKERR